MIEFERAVSRRGASGYNVLISGGVPDEGTIHVADELRPLILSKVTGGFLHK